jgi:hypothetical protein
MQGRSQLSVLLAIVIIAALIWLAAGALAFVPHESVPDSRASIVRSVDRTEAYPWDYGSQRAFAVANRIKP